MSLQKVSLPLVEGIPALGGERGKPCVSCKLVVSSTYSLVGKIIILSAVLLGNQFSFYLSKVMNWLLYLLHFLNRSAIIQSNNYQITTCTHSSLVYIVSFPPFQKNACLRLGILHCTPCQFQTFPDTLLSFPHQKPVFLSMTLPHLHVMVGNRILSPFIVFLSALQCFPHYCESNCPNSDKICQFVDQKIRKKLNRH